MPKINAEYLNMSTIGNGWPILDKDGKHKSPSKDGTIFSKYNYCMEHSFWNDTIKSR